MKISLKLSQNLALASLLLFPFAGHAGGDVSGGGTGAITRGKFVFLDLKAQVAALAEANPVRKIEPSHGLVRLKLESVNVSDLPGFKVVQERAQSKELQGVLYAATHIVSWNKTNAVLTQLNDAFVKADERYRAGDLIQVATHRRGTVYLQDKLSALLSPLNNAGMIVHETLRAMAYVSEATTTSKEVQELTEALLAGELNAEQSETIEKWSLSFSISTKVIADMRAAASLLTSYGNNFASKEVEAFAADPFGKETELSQIRLAHSLCAALVSQLYQQVQQEADLKKVKALHEQNVNLVHDVNQLQRTLFLSGDGKIHGLAAQLERSALMAAGYELVTQTIR